MKRKQMVLAKIKTGGHPSVSVPHRDMYHGIGPMDPERLNVFRTVREITGKATSLCASRSASDTAVRREAECLFWVKKKAAASFPLGLTHTRARLFINCEKP